MNALTKYGMDQDKIDLVKRTVAKDTSNDELAMFLYQCQRSGLDPLARQIYCIVRKEKGIPKATIQLSIDGARLIAERSGKYEGQDGPWWCGDDGVWTDVWLENTPPKAAKVHVYKAGARVPTPGIALYREYVPTYNGEPMGLWKSKPAHMLAKCAEMLALRKAFPQELSGLYTAEEMAQADVVDVLPPQPTQQAQEPRNGAALLDITLDAEPPLDSEAQPQRVQDTPSFRRLHAVGNKTFKNGDAPEWDAARPWLVRQWTKHYPPQRESTADLSPDECDALADYIEDNRDALLKSWATQRAKLAKQQQEAVAA